MKSRMAIILMLVFGGLLSTSGVGLAVSGSSSSGEAAAVQYQDDDDNGEKIGTPARGSDPSRGTPLSGTPVADSPPAVAATQQVEAVNGGNELPFTGFSAIPVLLGGLALLGLGLVLRRQTRQQQ